MDEEELQALDDRLENANYDHFYGEEQRVDPKDSSARWSICSQCPNLKMNVCTKCGCFMPLKTMLEWANCPEGKW